MAEAIHQYCIVKVSFSAERVLDDMVDFCLVPRRRSAAHGASLIASEIQDFPLKLAERTLRVFRLQQGKNSNIFSM
jgi:hypothetical protein